MGAVDNSYNASTQSGVWSNEQNQSGGWGVAGTSSWNTESPPGAWGAVGNSCNAPSQPKEKKKKLKKKTGGGRYFIKYTESVWAVGFRNGQQVGWLVVHFLILGFAREKILRAS
jgi:hypothetical protein